MMMTFQQHHQILFSSILCFKIVNLFLFIKIKIKSIREPNQRTKWVVFFFETTINQRLQLICITVSKRHCPISNIHPHTSYILHKIRLRMSMWQIVLYSFIRQLHTIHQWNLKDFKSARKRDKMHQICTHKIALTHRIWVSLCACVFICKRVYPYPCE